MPRRARRTFTPEFKAEVVLALLRGEQSHAELYRLHQLSPGLLSPWKQTFLDRLSLVFQSDERRGGLARPEVLRRACSHLQALSRPSHALRA
jgi:transposase-like protein